MNFFDYIKKIFKKEDMKMLNKSSVENKLNNDETIHFIPINTIEAIINNESSYKKFKMFDKTFFDGKVSLDDYKDAIMEYVDFMTERE